MDTDMFGCALLFIAASVYMDRCLLLLEPFFREFINTEMNFVILY